MLASLLAYLAFAHGGIRSPDSDVVYRMAESLALRGSVAVTDELPWNGFGLPHGTDGRRYSLFGPMQSILIAPLVQFTNRLANSGFIESHPGFVPVSHYVGDDLQRSLQGELPRDPAPHARRMVAFFFNPLLCAAAVWLVFVLTLRMTSDRFVAVGTALLFGFGTLWLPYSGTFFSEPLATLLCLVSLAGLPMRRAETPIGHGRILLSGLALGLAVTAHISTILYLPFIAAIAGRFCERQERWITRSSVRSVAFFSGGVAMPLLMLGCYNAYRFGSAWETGRTVAGEMAYGVFADPRHGLYGLLFSPGKGLLLFCPLVLLGMLGWSRFHREFRSLSIWLGAALLFRLVFLACRSDWHGGYSMGPRYLVATLPFLVIPIGVAWASWRRSGNQWGTPLILGIGALAMWEQVRLTTGEIFSFLHVLKWNASRAGIDVFARDRLYMEWDWSPLSHLVAWKRRGPWLLQAIPVSNEALALAASIVLAGLGAWMLRAACRSVNSEGVPRHENTGGPVHAMCGGKRALPSGDELP